MRVAFLLSLILVAPLFARSTPTAKEQQAIFIRATLKAATHLNPDVTKVEVQEFCWSTWEGCKGDEALIETYVAVCIEETSISFLDNEYGIGFCGAYWPLVNRTLRKHGVHGNFEKWVLKHPYKLNKWLAEYFCYLVKTQGEYSAIRTWRIGYSWRLGGNALNAAEPYLADVQNKKSWYKSKFAL